MKQGRHRIYSVQAAGYGASEERSDVRATDINKKGGDYFMMASGVSGLTVTNKTLSTSDSGGKNSLGKEAFLTLLVTQLQNQDPLKPMEDKEFTAQLAQFSSLEEMKNISKSVDGLAASQASSSKTDAVGFIGKNVKALGGYAKVSGGSADPLQYELAKDASSVDIKISDASGKLVRLIQSSGVKSGANSALWDGRDNNGKILPDGGYTFDVAASDSAGGAVQTMTTMAGTVTSVKYELGEPYLMIGSVKVLLNNVMEVK